MKIMSFNFQGLAGPHKISTFMRVITLEHPDIMMLQEILGVGEFFKSRLKIWLPRWIFETLDVRGHSGGLAVEWNERSVKSLNLWGMESVLGLNFLALELGETFSIFNIYGPYLNRV